MRVLYDIDADKHMCIVHETTTGRNDLMSLRELISSVYVVGDRVVGFDYDDSDFALFTVGSIGVDLTGRFVKHINIPIFDEDYISDDKFHLNMFSAGEVVISIGETEDPVSAYWVFAITGEPFEGIIFITEDEDSYYQYDYDFQTKECHFSGSILKADKEKINLSPKRGILMKGEH